MRYLLNVVLTSLTVLALFSVISCASTQEVTENFQNAQNQKALRTRKKTVVLFLIDGLGDNLFRKNFDQLPNITSFFHVEDRQYATAHSIFPSLTFPNLISLMTRTPADRHSVVGNQMLLSSQRPTETRILDFEKREDVVWLNTVKENALVFSQLKTEARTSVSFAQSLFMGASAEQAGSIPMGLSYLNKNYISIDRKNIKSLWTLLEKTKPQQWPDFIFIHLIGADAIAHDLGPFDPSLPKYLKLLDSELAPIFSQLIRGQHNGVQVASILTADHGFINVESTFDLETLLQPIAPSATIVNEGRHASITFNGSEKPIEQLAFLSELSKKPEIELTMMRLENSVTLFTKKGTFQLKLNRSLTCPHHQFSVEWKGTSYCPQKLNELPELNSMPSFAPENLVSYLAAPQHPDAAIVAADGISFFDKYRGHHGGLSSDEVIVPLLLRGIVVRNQRVPALYEILNVLDQ